ncbi:MAG: D-alanyl-D-alanine carboxypeptidase family protein [Oscillospiraceae bacterium]|nr:D-alanyl-D-alanine carboxypeptidase family protein [Oscillospiraceae bacterium]
MKKRTGLILLIALLAAVLLGLGCFIALRLSAAQRAPEPSAAAQDTAAQAPSSAAPIPAADPDKTPEPTATPEPTPEPADSDLVLVKDVIPTIYVDLRYATTDNFTGQRIYDFTDARLRYGTLKKLARVQEALLAQGYSLKIWDAYRPVSAQFRLWEVCPNSAYVANPNNGYSSHSRGNTIDLTLVRADGTEIPMPSGFDEFSALADRNYSDVSAEAQSNVAILESAMQAEGFVGYSAEWWHYSDGVGYDVVME